MRPKLGSFSRYRPPVLTLVLVAVAAAIALANLSSEAVTGELIKRIADRPQRAYGWPLTWYWRVADPVPSTLTPWGGRAPRPVLQWPISRYRATYLLADLAIWLAILAGSAMASRRLLRRYQPRLQWRPRVTTFVVLLAIAAPTVLANLSFEVSQLDPPAWSSGSTAKVTFGWPLVWNWYVVAPFDDVYGWDFSAFRLANNVLIWLAALVLAALAWEWLLRRWRPQVRFSLRTMLAAVALIAMLCAWGASVWKRAEDQDALVASGLDASKLSVRKRGGPKWLGLVLPDRFRRCVVGAEISIGRSAWYDEAEMDADESDNLNDDKQSLQMGDARSEDFDELSDEDRDRQEEDLLKRLGRLPALRFLDIHCGQVTPATAAALTELRQIRSLHLGAMGVWSEEARPIDLAWLAKLQQLEHISLRAVHSDDFAGLCGVTNLKSLAVDLSDCEHDEPEIEKRLAAIGKLTQLRRVYLYGFPGAHVAQLGNLANLKSLSLDFDFRDDPKKRHACLAAVGRMSQLERLQLESSEGLRVRPHDLACLRGLTNLKSLKLFISSFPQESHACLAEIGKLTQLRQLWLEGDLVDDGLAELAPLESLEEITSDNRMATVKSLESLCALQRLNDVCILGLDLNLAAPIWEAGRLRRALQSLERAHPGIAVDRDYHSFRTEDQEEQFPWLVCEQFNDREDLESYLRAVPMGP